MNMANKDKDVHGWGPDVGKFVVRDGITYTEHGWVLPKDALYRTAARMGGVERKHDVNYADWTTTERAEVAGRSTAEADERAARAKAHEDEEDALVASARSKLTEEEFAAVCGYGRG